MSTAPGSSSMLVPSVTFVVACFLTSTVHLFSCLANMAEHGVVPHCHLWRLLARPHFAQRWMLSVPNLLLGTRPETCSSSWSSQLLTCLVFLWSGVRGERSSHFGCAKMATALASKMLPPDLTCHRCPGPSLQSGFSSLLFRASKNRLHKSPLTPCYALSDLPYGCLEELRIDSDHIQTSGFDVLR